MLTMDSPHQLRAALTQGERLAGLDIGEKTIGLAISDRSLMIATPHDTIRRTKFKTDAGTLRTFIEKEKIGGLVIGYPLNMDGTEGPRCQSTRQFVTNLTKTGITLPVLLWDERMSTTAVTRTLLEADMSRQKRAHVVDKMAAAYILQGVLDAI